MTNGTLSVSRLRTDPVIRIAVRVLVYAASLAAVCGIVILQATAASASNLYAEDSVTEYLQLVFLLVPIAIFARIGASDATRRCLCVLLGGLLSSAVIRECDWVFERHVFAGAWQACVGVVLAVTLAVVYRRRRELRTEIENFAGTPSFGIMLSGFLIVGVFSRLFGKSDLWKAVMGHGYTRMVKGAVEENVELLGYFLILVASIEWLLPCVRASKTESQ